MNNVISLHTSQSYEVSEIIRLALQDLARNCMIGTYASRNECLHAHTLFRAGIRALNSAT